MCKCKLSPKAFGLALGTMWGMSVFLVGLAAHFFEYGVTFVTAMGAMYVGYDVSVMGSFIGGFFGFLDGFIGGAVLIFLYNLYACCCKKECTECCCDKKTS
jgi:hypothetical protein